MQFKNVELSDKPEFDKYYEKNHQLSSYTSFVTLYTWRHITMCSYTLYNDKELIIRLKNGINDEYHYLLPQLKKNAILEVTEALINEENAKNFYFTTMQKEVVEKAYKSKLSYTRSRKDDNYIYTTEKLIKLGGKKLHSKRNFINRFKNQYEYSYISLDKDSAKECILTAREWLNSKNTDDESYLDEIQACEIALNEMDALGLKGGAIKVDNKIIAFALGEKISEDTAIIHFEKANTNYDGIYQMINNEVVKYEFADTLFINREEDMGVEGLRKAKMSYYPDKMLEYYAVKKK